MPILTPENLAAMYRGIGIKVVTIIKAKKPITNIPTIEPMPIIIPPEV
jgi:hypothetical protein